MTRTIAIILAGVALSACADQALDSTPPVTLATHTETVAPGTIAVSLAECGWLDDAGATSAVYEATSAPLDTRDYSYDPDAAVQAWTSNAGMMWRGAALLSPYTGWPMIARMAVAFQAAGDAYGNAALAAATYDVAGLDRAAVDLGASTAAMWAVAEDMGRCMNG